MKRLLAYLIPVVTLILFFFIMNGGIYLKQRIGETDDHFLKYHEKVIKELEEGNWEKAMAYTDKLEESWKKKIPKIQFSVERDQINGIDVSLARLKGYLEAKDKAGCFAELYEAKSHWDDLGH